MNVKDLPIKTKLFLLSGVLIAVFSGMAAYQLYSSVQQSTIAENIYKGSFTANSSLKNLQYGTKRVVDVGLDLVAGDVSMEDAQTVYARYTDGDSLGVPLAKDWKQYREARSRAEGKMGTEVREREKELYSILEERMGPFIDRVTAVHETLQGASGDFDTGTINTQVVQMMVDRNKLESVFNRLVQLQEEEVEAHYEQSASIFQANLISALVLVLLCIVVGIGLTLYVARLIVRPIKNLEHAMTDVVEEGDLSREYCYDGDDEIGSMAASFNAMIARIREILDELKAEKESVQRRVDEAVEQSERRRKALAACVERMCGAMREFANGDLTVRLDTGGGEAIGDEGETIGKLFEGFNEVVSDMRAMILKVRRAVATTSSTAEEVSASTDQVATGAEEQSSQAEEVAAAVEEMTRTIADNSKAATETSALAQENRRTAHQNGEAILQAVHKMQELGDVIERSAKQVDALHEASEEIGEVVETIDEIANQTNLLALNAAIEAARAGDESTGQVGQGFGVVAEEVRELAGRADAATDEIADKIQGIQEETQKAVRAMETGRDEVESGIELAEEAREAFEEIVADTEKIDERIEEIAAATEEQSSTSEQISHSIESISTVSQQTARAVHEIAEATGKLEETSVELRRLVEQFTVSEEVEEGTEEKRRTRSVGDGEAHPLGVERVATDERR